MERTENTQEVKHMDVVTIAHLICNLVIIISGCIVMAVNARFLLRDKKRNRKR